MEKIFTVLTTKEEVKTLKKVLKVFDIAKKNIDISKVFVVQGCKLVYFAFVTDEETFTEITKSINGQRIY